VAVVSPVAVVVTLVSAVAVSAVFEANNP